MKHLYLAALSVISIFSCQSPAPQETLVVQEAVESPVISGKFVHMVFFWLTPETDVDKFLADSRNLMEKVDVIKQYHLGKPAMTPRDVVDNTYTVCLIVTFDTKEDHEIYQKDATHDWYRNAIKESIAKLQIYDSWAGE